MKPHPRIRKTIKWGGAALTVLLVAVWIGSGLWCVTVAWNGWVAVLFRAHVVMSAPKGTDRSWVWHVIPQPDTSSWLGTPAIGGPQSGWILSMPLWVPTLLVLCATALAFRLDTLARRRARMNLCKKCHYDRTGLPPDAVCPECGTPIQPSATLPPRLKASP